MPAGALDFLTVLWSLDHALQKRSKQMASRVGVTGPQRFALRVIERSPGLSAGDLAALLHVHPSTLTGVLQRLEDGGLIRRAAAKDDLRRAELRLTAAGRRQARRTPGTIEHTVAEVLARTSRADIATTTSVLRTLVAAFAEDDG
jgi:DNA-binding MarR family transcriptional regulator